MFGDTLRSLKSSDGVVNRAVGKNCSVIVELEEDGKQYRIERYRNHSKKKNNLYLYIDDVDSRGKDNRETQEFIESIIGMDKISFSNSIAAFCTSDMVLISSIIILLPQYRHCI